MGKQKVYSPRFKLMIAKEILDNHLSYCEIIQKYFLHLKNPYCSGFIKKWVEIYLREGLEGLSMEKCGRYKKKIITDAELAKTNLKEALEENERLRAEILFLKKLRVLVLEEEQENSK